MNPSVACYYTFFAYLLTAWTLVLFFTSLEPISAAPDTVRPGLEDIAPADIVVVEHIGFYKDLGGLSNKQTRFLVEKRDTGVHWYTSQGNQPLS